MLHGRWVKFDDNVKTSCLNLLNKVFEYDLKHIVEDNLENASNSIKNNAWKKIRREFWWINFGTQSLEDYASGMQLADAKMQMFKSTHDFKIELDESTQRHNDQNHWLHLHSFTIKRKSSTCNFETFQMMRLRLDENA